ncbi:MAG TPA: hypothetical protein VMG82_04495 [Candidatus Sulfotelmatobacter sp.]|nr:hypothetical protein [Candidatus Sulfotelmatobacter sp.]
MAQHHGGHGMGGNGIPGGSNRPTGVDEKDTLKDFHRALAMQATTEQIAEFRALVKSFDTAQASLTAFLQQQPQIRMAGPGSSAAQIDQLVQNLRTDHQKFVDGFSAAQKSGLKELVKKLGKSSSDLEANQHRFDESIGTKSSTNDEIQNRGESLTKSLSEFSNQDLALGREIGIMLAASSDETFELAEVKNSVVIGKQTISIPLSGNLSQVGSAGGQRTFNLRRVVDLSDLQEKITEVLRAQTDKKEACGEQLAVREATISSSTPASILTLDLHYERRSCMKIAGRTGWQELAEGDGSVELKLIPVVEKANELKVVSEFSRINASGVMNESLRSGVLGEELRAKLSEGMLAILETGVRSRGTLPLAIRDLATVHSAKFQEIGIGKLGAVLEGQLDLTEKQISHLVRELNQDQFARGTAPAENSSGTPKSAPQP